MERLWIARTIQLRPEFYFPLFLLDCVITQTKSVQPTERAQIIKKKKLNVHYIKVRKTTLPFHFLVVIRNPRGYVCKTTACVNRNTKLENDYIRTTVPK